MRTQRLPWVSLAILMVLSTLGAGSLHAQFPPNTPTKIRPYDSYSFCVNRALDVPTNGTPVHLWSCGGNAMNETWVIEYEGQSKTYKIRMKDTNYCLHTKYPHEENGNPLQIWNCSEGTASNWGWTFVNVGSSTLLQKYPGNKCMHRIYDTAYNGNGLHLWDCLPNNANDLWYIAP